MENSDALWKLLKLKGLGSKETGRGGCGGADGAELAGRRWMFEVGG